MIYFFCIEQLFLIIFIRHTKSRPVYFVKNKKNSGIQSAVFPPASFQTSGVTIPRAVKAKEAICRAWKGCYFLCRFNATHSWVPSTGILLTACIHKRKRSCNLWCQSETEYRTLCSQVCPIMMAPMLQNQAQEIVS